MVSGGVHRQNIPLLVQKAPGQDEEKRLLPRSTYSISSFALQ
jgi:hypothetical protein